MERVKQEEHAENHHESSSRPHRRNGQARLSGPLCAAASVLMHPLCRHPHNAFCGFPGLSLTSCRRGSQPPRGGGAFQLPVHAASVSFWSRSCLREHVSSFRYSTWTGSWERGVLARVDDILFFCSYPISILS